MGDDQAAGNEEGEDGNGDENEAALEEPDPWRVRGTWEVAGNGDSIVDYDEFYVKDLPFYAGEFHRCHPAGLWVTIFVV